MVQTQLRQVTRRPSAPLSAPLAHSLLACSLSEDDFIAVSCTTMCTNDFNEGPFIGFIIVHCSTKYVILQYCNMMMRCGRVV